MTIAKRGSVPPQGKATRQDVLDAAHVMRRRSDRDILGTNAPRRKGRRERDAAYDRIAINFLKAQGIGFVRP